MCLTMWICIFVLTTVSGLNDDFLRTGVLENEKGIIMKAHNVLRRDLSAGKIPWQPKPKYCLPDLEWDEELAETAQKISERKIFAHSEENTTRWENVGQNLYRIYSTVELNETRWDYVIQKWFSEYKNYTYSSELDNASGHYTQIVWENTTHIGCGYSYYEPNRPFEEDGLEYLIKFEKLFVCHYGPRGNEEKKYPYRINGDVHLYHSSVLCLSLVIFSVIFG